MIYLVYIKDILDISRVWNIFWCWSIPGIYLVFTVDISICLVYTSYILSIYECLSIHVVHNSMFWCRFSRFTLSWRFCTTPWPSKPSRHGAWPTRWRGFWRSRYSFPVGWVYGQHGAISQRWLQEPKGRLARKRYISSIYRLYSCHMMTSFHLYTDSILVIWRLHSIYIPTLFFWAGEGCWATLAA